MSDFSIGPLDNFTLLPDPEVSLERRVSDLSIPGRVTQSYNSERGEPIIPLQGRILPCAGIGADILEQQLRELIENIAGYPFFHVQFPIGSGIERHSGFYIARGALRSRREEGEILQYQFALDVQRKGLLSNYRLATVWEEAEETYIGWAILTPVSMISLPHNVSDVAWTAAYTRVGSDGGWSNILENPTRQTILYKSSVFINDWFKADARCYDTMRSGNTDETTWIQVFSSSHVFLGDRVFQNGLLRYKIVGTVGTFYLYAGGSWKSIGTLDTNLTGNLSATIKYAEVLRLSSEVVSWKEIRMNGINPIDLTFTLRRGALHCKVVLATHSLDIGTGTYVRLSQTGAYAQFFNSTVNGASGGGNLNQDAVANYECGYSVANGWVAGFALLDQPTKQPYDIAGSGAIAESNTWGTSTTRTFFVIAWEEVTNPFVIATGRANALAISRHCLQAVEQELVLVPRGFYI